MKKITFCLLASFVLYGNARNMYVYQDAMDVAEVTDVRRITFDAENMIIQKEDRSVVSMALSSFNNYTIGKKKLTGLAAVRQDMGLQLKGETLLAEGAESIILYNAGGTVLGSSRNGSLFVVNCPSGVYIVKTTKAGKEKSQKVIIK